MRCEGEEKRTDSGMLGDEDSARRRKRRGEIMMK